MLTPLLTAVDQDCWQLRCHFAGVAPPAGKLKVLVLDNAHRIADQALLAVLLRLRQMTGAASATSSSAHAARAQARELPLRHT